MIVRDHEPQWWFLLEDGERLLFDVNCSHGAVSYSWLMALNADETAKFKATGKAFLNELAKEVQWSAPGVRGSTSAFLGRNICQSFGKAATEAIDQWHAKGGDRNA